MTSVPFRRCGPDDGRTTQTRGSPGCGLAVVFRGGYHRGGRPFLRRFADAGSANPGLPAIGNVSLKDHRGRLDGDSLRRQACWLNAGYRYHRAG
jgi:hypothetical protein